MNTLALIEFSLSEIAAGLTIIGAVGGAILWALSTQFVRKKSFYFVRDKVINLEQQQQLAKQPFEMLVEKMDEVTAAIREGADEQRQQTAKMMEAIVEIDKRVLVLERAPACRRHRELERV